MPDVFCKLFNRVLDSGSIPEEWMKGLILPIYKGKGNRDSCDNYRGITLLSCMGKLFTSILNRRLTSFLEKNKLLSENQAGFRGNHSTIDHAFVLKVLVDVFCSLKQKLFCAFIDYRKAFDSIWRKALWYKLIKEGINGKVFNVIFNMYKNIQSCVLVNRKKSDFFGSFQGVRQGENLSPVLFSLFLNDLEQFLLQNDNNYLNTQLNESDKLTDYITLLVLLYADDTLLLSSTAKGLQRALDSLFEYCSKWNLQVNSTKTKVMIFNTRTNRLKFYFGRSELENVNSMKYLGILFHKNGKFYMAKKAVFEQAQRAMFHVLQVSRTKSLNISVTLDMFEKMVLPVLLYGSEIWGYENVNILEKLQLQFLKYVFHLPRNTMTDMLYGETGFVPVSILIKSRLIRFWSGLVLSQNAHKLSSKMYKLMYDLHRNDVFECPWLDNVKSILIECGYDCVWETQSFSSRNSLCTNVTRALKDKFIDSWSEAIQNSNKCLYYKHYKF